MKISQIYFPAKGQAALQTEEFSPKLASTQVLVKADYDVLSAGTELANYHALPNTGAAKTGFPFHGIGYSVSGHVVEIGAEVTTLSPGDHVVVRWGGHRSWFVQEEKNLFKIPADVDMRQAAFAHLASFSFLGVRKLQVQLGEAVMVAGQGLLGLLANQIARQSGACPVLASDLSQERRELALQLGADHALDPRDPDFVKKVTECTGGRGPECVVEVTGYIPALQQALQYIAWQGRISLLGCTRVSDQPIDFYRDVHSRGVSLIGCHTLTRPHEDSRPGQWTEFDDYRTFFRLLQAGRLKVAPLIHEIVSPRDAAEVYDRVGNVKQPPVGILFDWTDFE
ncbi:MAG: zinc-binding dehydrogenase [Victivallales bacterium]|nr:zinc-binding dehydrogenase [Victivallales bacterium]